MLRGGRYAASGNGGDGSCPYVEIERPGHPVEPMMPLQMSSDAKGLMKGD